MDASGEALKHDPDDGVRSTGDQTNELFSMARTVKRLVIGLLEHLLAVWF
jgi:hypothetical protein